MMREVNKVVNDRKTAEEGKPKWRLEKGREGERERKAEEIGKGKGERNGEN